MANTQLPQTSPKGFNQMAVGLTDAVKEFESQSPRTLTTLVDMFKPVTDFSLSAWRTTSGYARRHPLRIAVTIAALGLLAAQLMKPAAPETER